MTINYSENNKKEYKDYYSKDVEMFESIVKRYQILQENDILGAFNLMKDSLQAYNRWSVIREDIRRISSRGQNSDVKERLKEILSYLDEVHIDSRMIWNQGKNNYRNHKEE